MYFEGRTTGFTEGLEVGDGRQRRVNGKDSGVQSSCPGLEAKSGVLREAFCPQAPKGPWSPADGEMELRP
jgi:hypothetical protein